MRFRRLIVLLLLFLCVVLPLFYFLLSHRSFLQHSHILKELWQDQPNSLKSLEAETNDKKHSEIPYSPAYQLVTSSALRINRPLSNAAYITHANPVHVVSLSDDALVGEKHHITGNKFTRTETLRSDPSDESELTRKLTQMRVEHFLMKERQKLEEEKRELQDEQRKFEQHIQDTMNVLNREKASSSSSRSYNLLSKVSANDWEGLNSTKVNHNYPGIILLSSYKRQDFLTSSDVTDNAQSRFQDLTDGEAEDRFFELLSSIHIKCLGIRRMGSRGDGGWDICIESPYYPRPGCIVYSFGINFDFSFDDAMSLSFDCEVKSFDPSMTIGNHTHSSKVMFYQLGIGAKNYVNSLGWTLHTFAHLKSALNHSNRVVDVVKMDIDYAEWECLRNMMHDGSLVNVKQLVFEIHTPEVQHISRDSTKSDFFNMYTVLGRLEDAGFRRYHFRYNPLGVYTSKRTGRARTCCYELFYLNIRFLVS